MKAKGDAADSDSERVLFCRGGKCTTCPSEPSWLVCVLQILVSVYTL